MPSLKFLQFSIVLSLQLIMDFSLIPSPAQAESQDSLLKAQNMYFRITGVKVPFSNQTLIDMAKLVEGKDTISAAKTAARSLDFYNVNLRDFFAPKSVRSESKDVPPNDFIFMGIANTAMDRSYKEMVRGDFSIEFKPLTSLNNGVAGVSTTFTRPTGILLRDLRFECVGGSNCIATPNANNRVVGRQIVPNQLSNNGVEIEGNIRIARVPNTTNLDIQRRAGTTPVPAAGALTSEQFLSEHAVAGTNRRLVTETIEEFLCKRMNDWRSGDERLSDHQVTRDIPRAPGGDPLAYHNECRTCHAGGLDGFRKAFAGFDYTMNAVTYTSGAAPKLLNQNFDTLPANTPPPNPFGAYMRDNGGFQNWENQAIYGTIGTYFGWNGALTGVGVSSFGELVANSEAFKTCAVQQVWNQICASSLNGVEGEGIQRTLANTFGNDNHNLRNLYVNVVLHPLCNGGLYEASGSGNNSSGGNNNGGNNNGGNNGNAITFNIPAGTGTGPWNTETAPLVVSMGNQASRTVRITNLDSTPKQLHSNGSPFCPHQPANMATGQFYDCVIAADAVGRTTCTPGNNPTMYDHNNTPSARFCVQVVP